jgi:tetratricopeptide (TPR) repeat protein
VLVDNGVAARLGDVVPAPNRSALDRRALEQLLIGLEYSQMGEREAQERRALSEASYAESEKHYRVALAIQPSDSEVRWRLAGGMARLGPIRRREALDVLLQGLQWDPFNEELAIYTALRQIEFGRFREAMELLDNFDALPQGKSNE